MPVIPSIACYPPAPTPWKDYFYYIDTFRTLDGWYQGVTGSASINVRSDEGLQLKTGTTANSLAEVARILTHLMYYPGLSDKGFLTWGKNKKFRAWFLPYTLTNQEAIIANGADALLVHPENHHIGFKIVNGVLYGSCGDGSDYTTVELLTMDMIVYKAEWWLMNGKVLFYVNDELKGQITTNIPKPATELYEDDYSAGVYIALKNTAAEDKDLRINAIEMWQRR